MDMIEVGLKTVDTIGIVKDRSSHLVFLKICIKQHAFFFTFRTEEN